MAAMASQHPQHSPPFVQRGFNIPSTFGIDPAVLSGVAESSNGGSSKDESPASSGEYGVPQQQQQQQQHYQQQSVFQQQQQGAAYFKAPWAAELPSPGSRTATMMQQQPQQPQMTTHDEYTEALHSLVSPHQHNQGSVSSSFHHAASPLSRSPTDPEYRGPGYNFHGYSPGGSHSSALHASTGISPALLRQASSPGLSGLPPPNQYFPAASSSWQAFHDPNTSVDVDIEALITHHQGSGSSSSVPRTRPSHIQHAHSYSYSSFTNNDLASPPPHTGSAPVSNASGETGVMVASTSAMTASHSHHGEDATSSRATTGSTGGLGKGQKSSNSVRRVASPEGSEVDRGRNASSGKAPATRPSRSRTRKPSYSRTVSPRGQEVRSIHLGSTSANNSPAVSSAPMPFPASFSAASTTGLDRYGGSAPSAYTDDGSQWIHAENQSAINPYAYPPYQHNRRASETASHVFAPSSFGDSPIIGQSIPLPDDLSGSLVPNYNYAASPGTHDGLDSNTNFDVKPPATDEKRRKRRESHNAVERRRRDNINERISELANLIPEILIDPQSPGGTTTSGGLQVKAESPPVPSLSNPSVGSPTMPTSSVPQTAAQLAQQAAANKPNKGVILTKSVEYIRYLQQLVQMQADRNQELENRVRTLEGRPPLQSTSGGDPSPLSSNGLATSHSNSPAIGMPLRTVDEGLMEDVEDLTEMSYEDMLGDATSALNFGSSRMDDIEESPGE